MKVLVVVQVCWTLLLMLVTVVDVVLGNTVVAVVDDASGCADPNTYEAIVIGAGPAGLQAALTLGRAMIKTLVINADKPRNWMVKEFHNFLGQDGENPAAFRKAQQVKIRKQYGDSVTFVEDTVTSLTGSSGDFTVKTEKGQQYVAFRVILALGLTEDVPEYPKAYRGLYYESIFQCPFCHGIEERGKSVAIIGYPMVEIMFTLKAWFPDILVLTNGTKPPFLDEVARARLSDADIPVEEAQIVDVEVSKDNKLKAIIFEGGKRVERQIIYHKLKTHQNELVSALKLDIDPMGNVKVHPMRGETSVPGIFAAGDMITVFHKVAPAVSSGLQAAVFTVQDLILLRERKRVAKKKATKAKE